MYTLRKLFFTLLIIIGGLLFTYSLNYLVLNDLIIGNPNIYKTEHNETSMVFDFFYTISSDTGYRPEPSSMNFLITFILGLLLGSIASLKIIWMKK